MTASTQPETLTTLYAGNHLITARYNYGLIEERIFNQVIQVLQKQIHKVREGLQTQQLDLFTGCVDANLIKLPICMGKITKPNHYDRVEAAARNMCTTLIAFKAYEGGMQYNNYAGLFSCVKVPDGVQRSNKIEVCLLREIAQLLVRVELKYVDKKVDGVMRRVIVPINYTTFKYEVCANAHNKYTPRIYKLLCSYKSGGYLHIKFEELRAMLDLGDMYQDSANFKLRVLKPVAEELAHFGDIWFDTTEHGFEVKQGKEVVAYRFKIHSKASRPSEVASTDDVATLVHYFKTQYGCKDSHIIKLKSIITDPSKYKDLYYRCTIINQEIQKRANTRDHVKYPAAYAVAAILEHFNN